MVEAYVMVMAAAGTARELAAAIGSLEGVRKASVVAGEFDIIADVGADSREQLLALVTDEIQSLEGAGRTRTCIVLE